MEVLFAGLAVAEAAGRASRGLVTVAVSDLDGAVADLAARGVVCGPVEAVGDAGRKAVATDPDGNAVALVQVAPA